MILEEAIAHCEAQAVKESECNPGCALEHRQLANWLKELKAYRETVSVGPLFLHLKELKP